MRSLVRLIPLAAIAVLATSCEKGPTQPGDEADFVVQELRAIADSVARVEGEMAAAPYRGLAQMVPDARHRSQVEITIDDQPLTFLAVAHERVITGPICPDESSGTTAEYCIPAPVSVRSLIAWHPETRRMIMLRAPNEESAIASWMWMGITPTAQLRYMEGRRSHWMGVSGTQTNSMVLGEPCAITVPEGVTCHRAQFTWAFEGLVVPPHMLEGATAKSIEMPSSVVAGSRWTMPLPLHRPPVSASPLGARFGVTVDSVVTLTLVVRNASDAPVELRFPTEKQYEFAIARRGAGVVWTSSAGKTFAGTPTTITIPPRETVTFTEKWKPTVSGDMMAKAVLPSTTFAMSAMSAFTIP